MLEWGAELLLPSFCARLSCAARGQYIWASARIRCSCSMAALVVCGHRRSFLRSYYVACIITQEGWIHHARATSFGQ